MSKFKQIKKALQENTSIIVVKTREYDDIIENRDLQCRFYIAPKTGLYTGKELQALMMSLFPGLKEDEKRDYLDRKGLEDGGGDVVFGYLIFSEKVGERLVWHEFVFNTDKEIFSAKGFINGKKRFKLTNINYAIDIDRTIVVKLFPNEKMARTASKTSDLNLEETISVKKLEIAKHKEKKEKSRETSEC